MTNLSSRWMPVFSYIFKSHYWLFQCSSLSNINLILWVWYLYLSHLINHAILLIHASELQLEASKQWASCDNSEGASRRGKLHIERILTAPETHTHSVRSLKTLPISSLDWSKCLGNSAQTILAFAICAQSSSECFAFDPGRVGQVHRLCLKAWPQQSFSVLTASPTVITKLN